MALKPCRECKKDVSTEAAKCPNCGVTRPTGSTTAGEKGCIGCFGFVLVIVLISQIFPGGDSASRPDGNSAVDNALGSGSQVGDRVHMHAEGSGVRVRKTRSANATIVFTLSPGTDLWVGAPDASGWAAAFYTGNDPDTVGFVKRDALVPGAAPPLMVQSWNWVKDPDFGSDGAIVWTAVVLNNTNEYLRSVRVEITTFDGAGSVIDTDFSYAHGLAPKGTASVKGYATYYGTEQKAAIRIVE